MRSKLIHTALVIVVGVSSLIMAADRQRPRTGTSQQPNVGRLELARYLPANCFLYIQFRDLGKQILAWQNSRLQQRYYNSKSFELWARRHLAFKLTQRLFEFEMSLGTALSLDGVRATADHEAAIAVYDIGGTQFVFVTRLDPAAAIATDLLSPDKFTEKISQQGQKYYLGVGGYSIQICYTKVNEYLIVATKEALLLDTLQVMRGNTTSLESLPTMQQLTKTAGPLHDITLWLDQERINNDWYFRHYWIHKNFAALKPFRTGLIDLEMGEQAWTERRYFLLNGDTTVVPAVSTERARQVAAAVPANVVAFQLSSLSEKAEDLLPIVKNVIFEYESLPGGFVEEAQPIKSDYFRSAENYDYVYDRGYYDYSDDEFAISNYFDYESRVLDGRHYTNTSSLFNVEIDDPLITRTSERETVEARLKSWEQRTHTLYTELLQSLAAAHPAIVARFAAQRDEANNVFIAFDRGAIVSLREPDALDLARFENALEELIRFHLVAAGKVDLQWQSIDVGGTRLRALTFPLLGRGVVYTIKGDQLFIFNRVNYAEKALRTTTWSPTLLGQQLTHYRVVRPAQGRKDFQRLFNRLDTADKEIKPAKLSTQSDSEIPYPQTENENKTEKAEDKLREAFFSGNIASLLEVISNVREVAVESEFRAGELHETVQYRFSRRTQ
ncbi:MAG: hypothetical protein AB1489_14060 [Acidobacteriota bacterium]